MTTPFLPVLIDTDPGADDMFALIRALIMHKKEHIALQAITTVGWNVWPTATFENACRACQMMGVDLPIWRVPEPKQHQSDASHIHGKDGIWGLSSLIPLTKKVDERESVDLLIETINQHVGTLTILAFGPLTNLAAAEQKKPGILRQAKQIILMGWAFFTGGNVTPAAEFNVWFDPQSAKIVMESGANLAIMPLDITESYTFGLEDLLPILDHVNNDTYRKFLLELTKFTIGTNMGFRETHYKKGFFVHDATTVAFFLYPHLFQGTFYKVMVETLGEFTKGKTLVDVRNQPKQGVNAFVARKVDAQWFLEAMTEDFKEFDFSK